MRNAGNRPDQFSTWNLRSDCSVPERHTLRFESGAGTEVISVADVLVHMQYDIETDEYYSHMPSDTCIMSCPSYDVTVPQDVAIEWVQFTHAWKVIQEAMRKAWDLAGHVRPEVDE